MQVFGYEKNGDATFYAATGQMDGNKVTAPLMRYQGGRSFGSEARDAVEDRSLGNVTVSFRNGLQGTVQFPDEPAMAIERFLVQRFEAGITNPRNQTGVRSLKMLVQDAQGAVAYHWSADLTQTESGTYRLTLKQPKFYIFSESFEPFQDMECQLEEQRTKWICQPKGSGMYLGPDGKPIVAPVVDGLSFQLAGYDLAGAVRIGGAESMPMTGYDLGAIERGPSRQEGGTIWTTSIQQDYQQSSFQKLGACNVACYGMEYINTLMPFNGTWIVEDELTGRPGRGLALDIQGNTAILQVYNYRPDSQPTFHMGNAAYLNKGVNSIATAATIPLNEYADGRSLGGEKKSAQLRNHAGNAQLEFAYQNPGDKPLEEWMWWTTGTLQLPQENPVRIRRLQLEKSTNFSEDMLGQWFLPIVKKTITLTRAEGGTVTSEDGLVVCTSVSNRPDADVSCGQPGERGFWVWHQFLKMPLMNRGGTMIRLRDRHGNAVGLGQLD
jgi:hypothetical protein